MRKSKFSLHVFQGMNNIIEPYSQIRVKLSCRKDLSCTYNSWTKHIVPSWLDSSTVKTARESLKGLGSCQMHRKQMLLIETVKTAFFWSKYSISSFRSPGCDLRQEEMKDNKQIASYIYTYLWIIIDRIRYVYIM